MKEPDYRLHRFAEKGFRRSACRTLDREAKKGVGKLPLDSECVHVIDVIMTKDQIGLTVYCRFKESQLRVPNLRLCDLLCHHSYLVLNDVVP